MNEAVSEFEEHFYKERKALDDECSNQLAELELQKVGFQLGSVHMLNSFRNCLWESTMRWKQSENQKFCDVLFGRIGIRTS